MKILFVLERRVNAGSIQAASNYVRAAEQMGHEICVYGRPESDFPRLRFSTEVSRFDHVLFIIESRLGWMSGLRLPNILRHVPRRRRAILDADGMYGRRLEVSGYDRNHGSDEDAARWRACYNELADRILQPTLRPLEQDVIPLLFYGYDPESAPNGRSSRKSFDIAHVGHNWWRWQEIQNCLLPAIERIRSRLGRICFLGLWWEGTPKWAASLGLEEAFAADPEHFRRLDIEVHPPVPYTEVVAAMGRARVNIMTQRPLFRRLGIVTSKYFELLCADTVPLAMLDPSQAESIYGPAGRELALSGCLDHKLLDALYQPAKYEEVVAVVRSHLAAHHSYRKRVEQLVSALGDC